MSSRNHRLEMLSRSRDSLRRVVERFESFDGYEDDDDLIAIASSIEIIIDRVNELAQVNDGRGL